MNDIKKTLDIIARHMTTFSHFEDEVQAFAEATYALRAQAARENTEPDGWISVKERWPSECERIIAYAETSGKVGEAWLHPAGVWVFESAYPDAGYVTHWRPLPNPPKEERI